MDHASFGDDGPDHILVAYATDEAVTAIRALGFTVHVDETEAEAKERLARALQDPESTTIHVDSTRCMPSTGQFKK